MLIKVSVENFKSFNKINSLNMIASTKETKIKNQKVSMNGMNLLKSAVIYGGNASGKSNLIETLYFIKTCVLLGLPLGTKQLYCRNFKENVNKNTSFEVQILKNGHIYAYGFSILLKDGNFTSEWAYELTVNGEPKQLFERNINEAPKLGSNIKLPAKEKERFNIYANDISNNNKLLFLSEMNRNKKIDENSKLSFFNDIFKWFALDLFIYIPGQKITDFEYYYENNTLDTVNEFIRLFDTGIKEVKIQNISMEDFEKKIGPDLLGDIKKNLENINNNSKGNVSKSSLRLGKNIYNFSLDKSGEISVTTIGLKHENVISEFNFNEESDGTCRLFDLMDIILRRDNTDKVYIVDELERSLHPKLTEKFLNVFNKINNKRNTQLIFSTHEASIMDFNMFRKDEIWFVERNAHNCSNIFPLDKFIIRSDQKWGKAYLEGRYGGLPVFKELNDSIEKSKRKGE